MTQPMDVEGAASGIYEITLTRADRLKLASVLLSYPGEDFARQLGDVAAVCAGMVDEAANAAVAALQSMPTHDRERCYVATFDMREQTALYLTAHELGDSRERGGALLQLHALLRSAQLEPQGGELPDYIPLLLEFLAEKPVGMPTEELEARLAAVCAAIHARLDDAHPYRPLFALLRECLPAPTTESTAGEGTAQSHAATVPKEAADVDNLPYPLVYD